MRRGGDEVVHGVVLCGGRSERFGSEKARVEVGGQSLLGIALGALVPWVDGGLWLGTGAGDRPDLLDHGRSALDPLRTARAGCDELPQLASVRDPVGDMGPLGGLSAALEVASEQNDEGWLIALSCDLPGIRPGLIGDLLTRARERGARVALPRTADGAHPLVAVYHLSCLPAVRASLAAGERRLVAFQRRLEDALEGSGPAVHEWDLPESLVSQVANVNTPAEFVSWRHRMASDALLAPGSPKGTDAADPGSPNPGTPSSTP